MNSFVLIRPGTVTRGTFFWPTIATAHSRMSPASLAWIFGMTAGRLRSPISTATVEVGRLCQTKYLQAGSGFLSQHTKELFFGVGKNHGPVHATIQWPSGLTQAFSGLPVNHRLEMEEGVPDFRSKPFTTSPPSWARAGDTPVA